MRAMYSSPPRGHKALANFWHDFEWPVMGALAFLAMLLGGIGYYMQFRADGTARSIWDVLYFDLQLFTLQMPDVKPPMHPALNFARFLARAVAGYTAWQAL